MRRVFKRSGNHHAKQLGRKRGGYIGIFDPFSRREKIIYGTLALIALFLFLGPLVRANVTEVGSIISLPASQCSSPSGWLGPEQATGQPEVAFNGSKDEFNTTNSAINSTETGEVTCLGYENTDDVRVAHAVTLSIAGFDSDNSPMTDYEPTLNTASTSPLKVEGRNTPVEPNAYHSDQAPIIDAVVNVEISKDNGESWTLLHVVGSSLIASNSTRLDVFLPEEYTSNLSKLGIRVVSVLDGGTGRSIYLDAATVTYVIGQDQEISLKAKDKTGKVIDDVLPVVSPNTTVDFELTSKNPNDSIVQGLRTKVGQAVGKSAPELSITATVEDENGRIQTTDEADVEWKQSGLSNEDTWDVAVEMPRSSEIGIYTVSLEVVNEDGAATNVTQDFLWGVLALNPDKSVYTAGDNGKIAMTVLDEKGKTICDADVTLEITGPVSGKFSTSDNSIATGEQCTEYGDHTSPDYSADFDFTKAGDYDLKLTAVTKNGQYSITDKVTAEDAPTFSVKRSGPTRIFPPVNYSMEFEVTANRPFSGDIKEAVPSSFEVYPTGTDSFNLVDTVGDTKYLNFPVVLGQGETVTLRYQFKAPDISPEFYLLGPLELKDDIEGVVFTETRQWQLAGDAVGRMILFYDGATIPSGWTCISCTGGDDFYQRFVRGAATYGGTGGSTTHTHTATGIVDASSSPPVSNGGGGTVARFDHGHNYTPVLNSPNNLPTYRQLKVIRYNSTGEPATLPAGVIAVFDDTVPTGWTRYSVQDGNYIRGEGTIGITGGANTHVVSISGSTSSGLGLSDRQRNRGTQTGVADLSHTHSVSGTSASSSNEPTYREVILGKLNSSAAPVNNIITMWDDEPATGWNTLSGSGGDLENRFIKPASTYGGTGGADTHTHSDTAITSGTPTVTDSSRTGSSGASDTHTHTVNITGYSSENHLPPYREAVFAKRAQITTFDQVAYRFYDNDNSADVGSPLAAQNTIATTPSQGTPFRLRAAVHISVVDMPLSALDLKLQYAQRSGTCDVGFSGETYVDVSPSSGDIRYYDNSSPSDGNALTTNANDPTHNSDTMRAQTYVEANNFTNVQEAVAIGEDGYWDFSLVDYSAPGSTEYCFRIVRSSGTELTNYTAVPEIITAVPPPSMVLLYDGATIPSGWSCVSCDSGDEAYQRFVRGGASSGTGGSATHTHTASGSVATAIQKDGRNNNGTGIAEDNHDHTFTPVIGAGSNIPSYRQLKFIKYNSGTPAVIPSGAIALFDAAVPSGWTRYSAQDGYFVRGEGTAGTTGGSNTHTNPISGTTGGSTGNEDTIDNSGNQEEVALAGHIHTVTGNTDSVDIQPPYIETILGQADSNTSIPASVITMWDQDPGGTWTCVSCTGSDAFYQTFIKPSASYGTTGGSATHTHGTVNLTSSLPDLTTYHRTGNGLASATHTHDITVDSFSTDNHLPPYIDYVFAKSASSNSSPNSPTNLVQEKIDTTNLAVGAWTNESTVVFKADATDPDNPDSLAICVEAEIVGTAFDNVNTACGSAESYSGSAVTATLTLPSLTDGASYHWQVRVKDGLGAYSSWVSFGANSEASSDFAVDSSGPTGTVYDGTTTNVDVEYNDGSLDSLSANWDIDASTSGLVGYDYSIGTTPGGTDVIGWTSNGTSASVTASSLTLNTSQPYYFNVRSTDNAGSQSIISSDGQFVAPTLSFTSSPNEVEFDNLGVSNGYTSTKSTTLTTSTNAYNGYLVRAYATGLLINDNLASIAMFNGGTYVAPDEWQSGDTGYGYTSNDSLVQGLNLFGSLPCAGGGNPPCYAPFTLASPGDIVADHTATVSGTPVVNENFIITHRVTTDTTQESGNYTTTIIFTVTAIY